MQPPPLCVPFPRLAEQHSKPDAGFAIAVVAELMQSDDLSLPASPILRTGNARRDESQNGTRNTRDQPNPLHVGFLI
jgi:hypothetical protein